MKASGAGLVVSEGDDACDLLDERPMDLNNGMRDNRGAQLRVHDSECLRGRFARVFCSIGVGG